MKHQQRLVDNSDEFVPLIFSLLMNRFLFVRISCLAISMTIGSIIEAEATLEIQTDKKPVMIMMPKSSLENQNFHVKLEIYARTCGWTKLKNHHFGFEPKSIITRRAILSWRLVCSIARAIMSP